jgi:hypothetical protein
VGSLNLISLYANEDFAQLKRQVLSDEAMTSIESVFIEQLEFAQQCGNEQAQNKIVESVRLMSNLLQALNNEQIQSNDELTRRLHEVELLLPYQPL